MSDAIPRIPESLDTDEYQRTGRLQTKTGTTIMEELVRNLAQGHMDTVDVLLHHADNLRRILHMDDPPQPDPSYRDRIQRATITYPPDHSHDTTIIEGEIVSDAPRQLPERIEP